MEISSTIRKRKYLQTFRLRRVGLSYVLAAVFSRETTFVTSCLIPCQMNSFKFWGLLINESVGASFPFQRALLKLAMISSWQTILIFPCRCTHSHQGAMTYTHEDIIFLSTFRLVEQIKSSTKMFLRPSRHKLTIKVVNQETQNSWHIIRLVSNYKRCNRLGVSCFLVRSTFSVEKV